MKHKGKFRETGSDNLEAQAPTGKSIRQIRPIIVFQLID